MSSTSARVGKRRGGRWPTKSLFSMAPIGWDPMGVRLANFVVAGLRPAATPPNSLMQKDVDLPMLDRMYKEYPHGSAPPAMDALASKIRAADAFVFIVGEYNWGVQPGLKNLTDHFLEEWFWRPPQSPAIPAGRFSGVRSSLAWRHPVRNGHGGDFEHLGGRSDRGNAGSGRRSNRFGRKSAGAAFPVRG